MRRNVLALATVLGVILSLPAFAASGWTLIGWNNLGMHCMDSDYSVFSILPPYNTIHAQLIDSAGHLVRNPGGIVVTYEAVRDPDGSINTTSRGKTGFWTFVSDLFGVGLADDAGLAGTAMPGSANRPQPMTWDAVQRWFTAEGIPITPYDDSGRKNPYPMMRLVARDASGAVLATTQIVLPVSDEMSCADCHASGSAPAARPAAGWVNESNADRDYRLNILRLHDEKQARDADYADALRRAGYRLEGLYATALSGHSILCARCHPSNALPGSGYTGIQPLTRSVHARHAGAVDPGTGMTLESSSNRAACYSCHPGSTTRCLRGAMGSSVAADGSMAIQCQGCHGPMSAVGGVREGWLDEPGCESCHTGTATDNAGQIRFTSVFTSPGHPRQPADRTFATNADVPLAGFSLYRFSYGHGGLACEACHGSTHAEYPSSHGNDNLQSRQIQGHVGMLAECAVCHGGVAPFTVDRGPHGMHTVGDLWVHRHGDVAEDGGAAQCRSCHGADLSGTVLSLSKGDWTATSEFGARFFWRGFRIGCYVCHDGPDGEDATRNRAPQVSDGSASTRSPSPVSVPLAASDPDGDFLELRVVSQPGHGTVGLAGRSAVYHPDPGFSGSDAFTFAAWDGKSDSNLGTVRVAVSGGGGGGCSLTCTAAVPSTATVRSQVPFSATAQATGCSGLPTYAWIFGDGGGSSLQNPSHAYAQTGAYDWSLTVAVEGQSCAKSGRIDVRVQQPTPAPAVTRVRGILKPFRVVIDGTGFQPDTRVTLNGQPWTWMDRSGSTKIVLREGKTLQARFPARTWVPIRLTNPDGQSTTVEFNRTTNRWRAP